MGESLEKMILDMYITLFEYCDGDDDDENEVRIR